MKILDEEPEQLTPATLIIWTIGMAIGFAFWMLIFYGVGRAIDMHK